MPLIAAATSFGSFRPILGTASPGFDSASVAHRPPFDPASEVFEARRRAIVCTGNFGPLERVAAFLLAISKNNGHEGRDPGAIPETLTCGFVADLLGIPIATLASLLKTLEMRGLIAADARSGVRLTNLAGLEKLLGV